MDRNKTHQTEAEEEGQKMNHEITWNLGNGMTALVTVELVVETEKTVFADGESVTIAANECDINVTGYVAGNRVGDWYDRGERTINGTRVVALVGKLAVKAAQGEQIEAAIAACEAAPEWQAKAARREAAAEVSRVYEAGRAKMRNAMGY